MQRGTATSDSYLSFILFICMKFKKEYRWLLFLIIPFIAFMFVLFMAPLQIVLNSQPLATQSYSLKSAVHAQNQLRSAAYQQAQGTSLALQNVLPLVGLYSFPGPSSFLEINVDSVAINNGYEYYHSLTPKNTSLQSMWFATAKNATNQLSPTQLEVLKSIRMSEGQVQTMLGKGAVGVCNYYDLGGKDDLVFYFPTYKEDSFSSLNQTIDNSLYQTLIANYNATGSPYLLVDNISRPPIAQKILSLCRLRTSAGISPGYTCVDMDALNLNSFLLEEANGTLNYYMLSPTTQTNNASIIDNLTASDGSVTLVDAQAILSDILPFHPLTLTYTNYQSPYLLTLRANNKIYYLLPLWVQEQSESFTTGWLLGEGTQGSSSADVQSTNVIGTSLNTLLIPTLILMVISLIISVVVLRFLMNGLDLQLHKLNQRCKFIFDGDLDIQIPEYEGTKDIHQVYEEVRIINKLHRYTCKDYFVGHFSNRIFKYNQALQVVTKLGYDPSNLMENIGQAYIYIEEYDKSIHYLKESVKCVEKQIDNEFGGLDRMVLCKQERQKVPNAYKDLEIVLIRRVWKLVFCLTKYVELQIINAKQLDQQNLTQQEKTAKKERLQKETLEYISKLKKAMYPDFKCYAESCMLLNFEIKFMMSIKNFDGARDSMGRCLRITQAYSKQYDQTTKKLKEKGSKNLYFFRRNKLSGHSRASPQIMEAFYNYTRSLLLTSDPKGKDHFTAFILLTEGFKKNLASHSVNFLLMTQIKKLLGGLGVPLTKLECTQVFRQSMPYKTLHYGPITKEIQATLYRVARNPAEVEVREYVIFLDASYYYSSERELTDQLKYLKERSEYLFDKLIKKWDRVSLIQANSEIGTQTLCNLTLKEFNQKILRKSLLDMTNYQYFSGRNELLPTLQKIIFRIRHLQCEKIVIFYLKYIDSYLDERAYKGRHKARSKRKLNEASRREELQRGGFMQQVGEEIQDLMSTQDLRNLKLLLVCATGDEYFRLINVFGLRDINRRMWSRTEGLNKNNNVVYIIDEKHKSDLDRILMSKLPNVSDNHVFAL